MHTSGAQGDAHAALCCIAVREFGLSCAFLAKELRVSTAVAEFISWVLGFREEARVIKREWLVESVKQALDAGLRNYK